MEQHKTDFSYLFEIPSFTRGMCRSLDLWGSLIEYNFHPEADRIAFTHDLEAVAGDFNVALSKFENEIERGQAQVKNMDLDGQ